MYNLNKGKLGVTVLFHILITTGKSKYDFI